MPSPRGEARAETDLGGAAQALLVGGGAGLEEGVVEDDEDAFFPAFGVSDGVGFAVGPDPVFLAEDIEGLAPGFVVVVFLKEEREVGRLIEASLVDELPGLAGLVFDDDAVPERDEDDGVFVAVRVGRFDALADLAVSPLALGIKFQGGFMVSVFRWSMPFQRLSN